MTLGKIKDHATHFLRLHPQKQLARYIARVPLEEGERLTRAGARLLSEENPPFDVCSVHPRILTYTNPYLVEDRLAPPPLPHPTLKPLLEGTRQNSCRTLG